MAAMGSIDGLRGSRLELSPRMRNAHEQIQAQVFKNESYVIRPADFTSIYSSDTIEADLALGRRLQQKFDVGTTPFDKNTKKIAEVLEGIVLMHSELSNWLGNARTLKTSQYDDFVNGVDMVSEWNSREGSGILALAVDVTFGAQATAKKIDRIKSELAQGRLGEIKYFRTEDQILQPRTNVPRIVIGVSQEVVDELAGLWLLKDNKALANHPIQKLFLNQMSMQLSRMKTYAASIGQEQCAVACDQTHAIIKRILENKASIMLGELKDDPVAVALKAEVDRQFVNTIN